MGDRIALMALKLARADGSNLPERRMIAEYETQAALAVAALDSMTEAERGVVLTKEK